MSEAALRIELVGAGERLFKAMPRVFPSGVSLEAVGVEGVVMYVADGPKRSALASLVLGGEVGAAMAAVKTLPLSCTPS